MFCLQSGGVTVSFEKCYGITSKEYFILIALMKIIIFCRMLTNMQEKLFIQ